MKNVAMIIHPDIFPITAGHKKAMYEVCRHLHNDKGLRLKLIVLSRENIRMPEEYGKICSEVVQIRLPRRWGIWDTINKFAIRLRRTVNCETGLCLGMRREVQNACADADVILMSFVFWYPLFTDKILRERTIVLTIDIFFYRRQSFGQMRSFLERLMVAWDRKVEVAVLKKFYRVCVLAEYEEKLLIECGIPKDQILRIGLPILMTTLIPQDKQPKFDFITIGSNIYQNEEGVKCFFKRVAPILKWRTFTLAVAGGLSNSPVLDSECVPDNIKICKLGYVQNLSVACTQALIGVGTVPYGSGIKVKVVEMIMNGLPVVVTNSGEEGIPVEDEGCINIDKLPIGEVACRLKEWLESPSQAINVGRHQGIRVREIFSPSACLAPLLDVISAK